MTNPTKRFSKKGIKAPEVFLAWLTGNAADSERLELIDGLKNDPNAGLLGVSSTYWIILVCYKLLHKFGSIDSPHITVEKMKTPEFKSSLRKYVNKSATMFFDVAVDTYDRTDYGSFKATLRSSKFLAKFDSKMTLRVSRVPPKELPDLSSVCKSSKIRK